MTTKLSKKVKLSFSILLIITLLSLVCSCTTNEQDACAEALTVSILDGFIANDYDAIHAIFNGIADDRELESFYGAVYDLLKDAQSYTLEQIGWHTSVDDGVSSYSVTFEMTTDIGEIFVIETSLYEDDNSLYGFTITPYSTNAASTIALRPFQIAFLVITLISTAFSIWMIVDCARRKIRKKALWIIIILLSASLICTLGTDPGFETSLSLILPLSSVSIENLSTEFNLTIPLGAIIYFFIRKRLKVKAAEKKADASTIDPQAYQSDVGNTPDNEQNQ